ncbi:MAG: hypothetical protein ACK6CU_01315 [Deltaproteobacteria bacterium]|jgi:hypothetical protein
MGADPELEPFELPPGLAEDAAESRRAGPTKAQRQRLRAKLGPGPGGPPGGSSARAARVAPRTGLAAAAALLLALGGGLGAWLWRADPHEAPGAPLDRRSPPLALATRSESATQVEPATPDRADSIDTATTTPDARGPSEVTLRDPPPEPEGRAPGADRGPRARPSEVALLETARAALARRPAEALRACERHRRLYPDGLFVEEREALAIEALARSGRRAEAARRFEAFRARFAGSPHRAHLEQVLAALGESGEN